VRTVPDNPYPGESVYVEATVSDDYRMKSVKFTVDGDNEPAKEFVSPNAIAKSILKTHSKSEVNYLVVAEDWAGNKVCHPSSCSASGKITFTDQIADPYVSSFSVDKKDVREGDKVLVKASVRNSGKIKADDLGFKIFIDDMEIDIGQIDKFSLGPSNQQAKTFEKEITVPALTQGTHSILGRVIYSGKDHDTSNNVKSSALNFEKAVTGNYRIDITTDKDSYSRGEEVKLSVSLELDSKPVPDAAISIDVYGPQSTKLTTIPATTNQRGRYEHILTTQFASLGNFRLVATYLGIFDDKNFFIGDAAAASQAKYNMELTTERDSYFRGEVVEYSGKITDKDGKPVGGALVSIDIFTKKGSEEKLLSFSQPVTATTFADGKFLGYIPISSKSTVDGARVSATYGGISKGKSFTITTCDSMSTSNRKKYEPSFILSKESYKINDDVMVSSMKLLFDGNVVTNKLVELHFKIKGDETPKKLFINTGPTGEVSRNFKFDIAVEKVSLRFQEGCDEYSKVVEVRNMN
jgi:hypothetical protein